MKNAYLRTLVVAACVCFGSCLKTNQTTRNQGPASWLNITIDPALGTVVQPTADSFLVALMNPAMCIKVPLLLHIPAGDSCFPGTRIDSVTWFDTVDISDNKAASLTVVTPGSGGSSYVVCFPYAFTNYPLGGGPVLAVYAMGDTIMAGTEHGLYISTNGGLTFFPFTTNNGLGANQVNGITVWNGEIYAATMGGLSISYYGGNYFQNYTDTDGLASNYVRSVSVQNNYIYAATDLGLSILPTGTNGGAGMQSVLAATGVGYPVTSVYALGNDVYAGTTGGFFSSITYGAVFAGSHVANGLGDNHVNGVFAADTMVYAATAAGLSVSTNEGLHFSSFTGINGLGANPVHCVYADGGVVYAGTDNGLTVIRPR